MEILILNQAFYPDTVASALYASDLAQALAEQGNRVKVLASRFGYDDPSRMFPRRETWRNVEIQRLGGWNLGKGNKWLRYVSFASVLVAYLFPLLAMRKCDVVIALTTPPLISFLGSLFVKFKGGRFVFWVMDLNPDEAVAAGWLKKNSAADRFLSACLRYSLSVAERVIVLDRFMRNRLLEKGVPSEKITIIPPWAHDEVVKYDEAGRNEFRRCNNLEGKFVVMYAGNHSPCNPLDTLLLAADKLKKCTDVVFVFMGGGSEYPKVTQFAKDHCLDGVRCFPARHVSEMAGPLSAADLHVVVMGDPFVGIIHPCKVYNVLTVGSSFLYIGPEASHVADIIADSGLNNYFYAARLGDVDAVADFILSSRVHAGDSSGGRSEIMKVGSKYTQKELLPKIISAIVP